MTRRMPGDTLSAGLGQDSNSLPGIPSIVKPTTASRDCFTVRPSALVSASALVLSLGLACLCLGCGGRPQAPSLRDGPVYHNRSAGFRFLVPQDWTQTTNSVLPDSTLERDFLLVQYRSKSARHGGMFEVICYERDSQPDAAAYHGGPSHGVSAWTLADKPDEAKVGGKSAKRYRFTAKAGEAEMVKEVLSCERGPRVLAFVSLYGKSDEGAAEEMRRAANSVVWD